MEFSDGWPNCILCHSCLRCAQNDNDRQPRLAQCPVETQVIKSYTLHTVYFRYIIAMPVFDKSYYNLLDHVIPLHIWIFKECCY